MYYEALHTQLDSTIKWLKVQKEDKESSFSSFNRELKLELKPIEQAINYLNQRIAMTSSINWPKVQQEDIAHVFFSWVFLRERFWAFRDLALNMKAKLIPSNFVLEIAALATKSLIELHVRQGKRKLRSRDSVEKRKIIGAFSSFLVKEVCPNYKLVSIMTKLVPY